MAGSFQIRSSCAGRNLGNEIFDFGSVESYQPTDVVTLQFLLGDETSNCVGMNAHLFAAAAVEINVRVWWQV